jgi:hypothetical protein
MVTNTGRSRSSIHSAQSSPKISAGCCVRTVPFPHASASALHNLSHPQQMRSGNFGWIGIFAMSPTYALVASATTTYVTPLVFPEHKKAPLWAGCYWIGAVHSGSWRLSADS